MVNLLLWILASIFVFYLFSRINVYIHFCYSRNGSNDHIAVVVAMLNNRVVYNLEAPLIEITRESVPWLRSVLETPDGRAESYTARERKFAARFINIYAKHPERIRKLVRISRRFFRQYRLVMNKLMSKTTCETIYWRTVFGSDQADVTGLMTGLIWSIKGLFLASLRKRCTIASKPHVRVVPMFGQDRFETELKCIFRIRLGNVINAVFCLIKSLRKGAVGSE